MAAVDPPVVCDHKLTTFAVEHSSRNGHTINEARVGSAESDKPSKPDGLCRSLSDSVTEVDSAKEQILEVITDKLTEDQTSPGDSSAGDKMDSKLSKSQSLKGTSTIADRLASLEKSGEEGWRKRIAGSNSDLTRGKLSTSVEGLQKRLTELNSAPTNLTSDVKMRRDPSDRVPSARPTSIADRLALLNTSQTTWKGKVVEKDTKQFTVEGKMNKLGVAVESPLTRRPRKEIGTHRDSECSGEGSAPTSPLAKLDLGQKSPPADTKSSQDCTSKEIEPVSTSESKSMDIIETSATTLVEVIPGSSQPRSKGSISPKSPESSQSPQVVKVPSFDDESLTTFFSGMDQASSGHVEKVDVSVDDFDELFIRSNDMLITARKVRPQRRVKTGSRNPLKTMSQLVEQEYTDVKTNIAEREVMRLKRQTVIGTPKLADEARRGLESKEDYSKVALRKADSFKCVEKNRPFADVMLLQIKGRRICQTRLIEPKKKSVNSGDCFLLITPDTVYLWLGQFSNVIERSKATELASQIHLKHDLGVKSTCQLVTVVEEQRATSRGASKFWKALGADDVFAAQVPGSSDEDELYETYMSEVNFVYTLNDDDKMVLVDEFTGKPLKHSMLRSTEVFAFDFGSEFYVWTGKHVPVERRKRAITLATELWEKGYDYRDYNINPICPLLHESSDEPVPAFSSTRPAWAILGKISQNMETALFKEKFIDWPEAARLIKVKENSPSKSKMELMADLKPYDVKKMIAVDESPVSLQLEGSHVGRGSKWEEMEDGIKWEYEILTHDVAVWHVMEFGRQSLEPKSYGQFHECDTYVIRWKYCINQIVKKLKSDEIRQVLTGRDRCAYFFWLGRKSSVNEKGTSALMTVELDADKGPQVRVSQGTESPCFINLFGGRMVIHTGKRRDDASGQNGSSVYPTRRLYMVRNELPNEAYLLEVPLCVETLRSRTSFVLMDNDENTITIWHGCKSPSHMMQRAKELSDSLCNSCPIELKFKDTRTVTIKEIREGEEPADFLPDVDLKSVRRRYGSLLRDHNSYDFTPRLFHMSSASGSFEVREIMNPAVNHDGLCTPYPFLQADLYTQVQPALLVFDNDHTAYLWQGCWPAECPETENLQTGTASTRFHVERRCAMETLLNYCKERNVSVPPEAYLVHAGCEPVEFMSLFPFWEVDEVTKQLALAENKVPGMIESVSEILLSLKRVRYSWAELQERPLPDGVDPLKLESYLIDDEFTEIMHCSREEFDSLPAWQQSKVKKRAGLF